MAKLNVCKNEWCYREALIDGYCRRCLKFEMQKLNIKKLQETNDSISQLTNKINTLEEKFNNLLDTLPTSNSTPTLISSLESDIKTPSTINQLKNEFQVKTDTFIPTINISNEDSNIKTNEDIHKSSKSLKNIAGKLKKQQEGN